LKAAISQHNLLHGTKNQKKWKKKKLKIKKNKKMQMGMPRSIGKQSGESMESVLKKKKKKKATEGRICGNY